MGKEVILTLFVLCTLMSVASAAIQGDPYDITHSVRVAGAPTTSASCNITVRDPNNVLLVSFARMTPNSTTQQYNYTLPGTQTQVWGTYPYDITCAGSGFNTTESFTLQVTANGYQSETSQSLIYIIMILVVVGLFLLSLYGAIKIPFSNVKNSDGEVVQINWKKYGKITCIGACYMFFTWIVFMAWNISDAYLNFEAMGQAFHYLYRALFAFGVPAGMFILFWTFYIFIKDRKFDQELQKLMEWE